MEIDPGVKEVRRTNLPAADHAADYELRRAQLRIAPAYIHLAGPAGVYVSGAIVYGVT